LSIKEVDIREFRDSDLNRILEIERKCFRDPWSRELFEFISRRYPSIFLVAESNGEIVGYVIAIVEDTLSLRKLRTDRYGHILNLAVDEKHRRRRIGSTLINSILKKLRERNVSKVYLEVRKSNSAAKNLYLKFNFKVKKLIKNYYPNDEDAYLMSKDLTQS